MVHLEFEGVHRCVEVDLHNLRLLYKGLNTGISYLVQEVHEKHLRVSFTTVTRARPFGRLANLDDNEVRDDMARALVETRVDFTHVVLLGTFTKRREAEWLGIQVRVCAENVEDDPGGGAIVTGTNNHTITDNQEKLAFIVILHLGQRVNRPAKRAIVLSVARNLANNEFIVVFRRTCRTKVDRGQELECDDGHHDARDHQENVVGELALSRLSIVDFADGEQVTQADFLTREDIPVDVQVVELLRDVAAGAELEYIQHPSIHEVNIRVRWCLGTSRGPDSRRGLQVCGDIIDQAVVHSDRASRVSHVPDLLGRVCDESDTGGIAHLNHALEVPIRTGVVGEGTEVVILGVGVGIILRVQDNVRTDAPSDTTAKCTNLGKHSILWDIVSNTKDIPELGRYYRQPGHHTSR